MMDHRYDALAAWNESAQTMTMAAVGGEPRPAYHPPVDPPPVAGVLPRHAVPSPPASHRALRNRRKMAVAGAAGIALLAAGAALAWTGDDPDGPVTTGAVAIGTTTTTAAGPDPAGEPAATETTSAAPRPSVSASASVSPSPTPSAGATPTRLITLPAGRASRGTTRTATAVPVDRPDLSAGYGYEGGAGSVRVVNSGTADATEWTVGLTVPGGETVTVTSGDVTVVQSGTSVTFRPSGARVPASGLVAFSFAVDPVPAEAPTGCTIDGRACS